MRFPEINCDLGEGISDEASIFPWIDTASVACGGHFGDGDTICHTLLLAQKSAKKAGAHPSYPDRENFGRKSLDIPLAELLHSLESQIQLFMGVAQSMGLTTDHIKFHGALYHDASWNKPLAEAIVAFLATAYPLLPLFVPFASILEKTALKKGIPIRREVFGDRVYVDNYHLASRNLPRTLLKTQEEVESQLSLILEEGVVQSISGKKIPIELDTLCFHGDNPGLMGFLPSIRKKWWK